MFPAAKCAALRRKTFAIAFSFVLVLCASIPASTQTATETTLYSLPVCTYDGTADSQCLSGGLMQANDGNFYGTTQFGGLYDWGTVFKITPSGSYTTLYAFTGIDDGEAPQSGVVQAGDGNLYGTATWGGYNGYGTIFKLTSAGTFSTFYAFRDGSDGGAPQTGLIQGSNGALFGVDPYITSPGDADGFFYTVSLAGNFTALASPQLRPYGNLLQGSDGNFYGGYGEETILRFTPAGIFSKVPVTCSVNANSIGLVEGSNQDLYASCGEAISKVTTTGMATAFYTLPASTSSPLLLGSDGNFYGTTSSGGANGFGQVFELTSSGTFTTLYSFTNGNDGENPSGGVMQGSDGNLYGTASGGTNGGGVIYKLTLSPELSPPVALTLSESTVNAYTPVTLSWVVPNAASDTMQQCYAFVQGGATGAGTWTGKQTGAYSDNVYFGSSSITPTAAGTYTYALTCGGVESGFATLTVNPSDRNTTTTSLTATPNPATVGQTVTLSSTVTKSSGSATPTGTVTFSYQGTTLTKATLNGSAVASYSASTTGLAAGTYNITATYSGDANYDPSSSAAVPVVLKAAAVTKLSVSPSVVNQGSSTSLSAQVVSEGSAASGTITFYYGSTAIGTGALNSDGTAALSADANVPKGEYGITAYFPGDGTHASAMSAPVTVTVQ